MLIGACPAVLCRNWVFFFFFFFVYFLLFWTQDPVLGGNLASPLVDGIQQNVMAITKHFMCGAAAPAAPAAPARRALRRLLSTSVAVDNHDA